MNNKTERLKNIKLLEELLKKYPRTTTLYSLLTMAANIIRRKRIDSIGFLAADLELFVNPDNIDFYKNHTAPFMFMDGEEFADIFFSDPARFFSELKKRI